MTRGVDVAGIVADTMVDVEKWCVDTWHGLEELEGATWPSPKLPCGTPLLVHWLLVKILWVQQIRTRDL
jgi:hypothetical protein